MAEPVVEENHTPETDPPPSFSSESDSIATLTHSFVDSFYNSSSEQALLVNSISDLRFSIDADFELTFNSVDDLYFPSENESFFIPVDANRNMSGDFTPVFGGIPGDCGNHIKNTNGVVSTTSAYCNNKSPMDSDCSGTSQSLSLSTQESADCVAHISEATTYKTSITKRKKEIGEEEDTSEESRNNKYKRRSDEDGVASVDEEDEEKMNARLIRNRESAQLSRQRKKHYVEDLEDKLKNLQSIITDLNSKVSYFMAENATLRHKVGSGKSMCWPHHQPALVPMPYPWMSFPAYMIKPQGSQVVVPLLPIPRLKPQQSLAKVKKSEAKTKKVASVSVLGLLFCLFLVGALSYVEKDLASEMKNEGTSGVGMCTEVLQFDVSSTSGAIVPASPATQKPKNTTDTRKGKNNRRILRGGLPVSNFNLTKDQNSSSKESFGATMPFQSMVVSVLVDPKEDSDGTKSLSRVFTVVLVDGVKYVTYSCVLPQPEVPHLVTT